MGDVPITESNPFVRKGLAVLWRVPRWGRSTLAKPEDFLERPPILANSFPKSGTHLLLQVVSAFPGTRTYGTFLASQPSITFHERRPSTLARRLAAAAPGEITASHLFHHQRLRAAAEAVNAVHFFIYRDLRDVVVSEAHYLASMNRWHRMHRHFKQLPSTEARIHLAITGAQGESGLDYPDVGERFGRYLPWLADDDVMPVSYESLTSPERQETIRAMARFFGERSSCRFDVASVAARAEAAIDPRRSRTFRRGGAGRWKEAFSDRNKAAMKEVAGDLLEYLGYEHDRDW